MSEQDYLPTTSKSIDSSYTKNMPEVMTMCEAIKSGNSLFWYELVQNAIDYHKYNPEDPLDLPFIQFVLKNGKKILHDEIDNINLSEVVRIEVHNTINGDTALDPYDIADIAHGGGESTLGVHGRGGTVAVTAALSLGLIDRVEYTSISKKNKSWHGFGTMKSLGEEQHTPRFVIDLDLENGHPTTETIITLHNPKPELIKSIKDLAKSFLLANPRYKYSKLKTSEGRNIQENTFTVYAPKSANELVTEDNLPDKYKASKLARGKRLFTNIDSSLRRVEILDDSFVSSTRSAKESVTNYVFVDGLRVYTYNEYLFNWSFSGFKSKDGYGSNPHRSNDSKNLSGSCKKLVLNTLRNCNQPEIFFKIFSALNKDLSFEETKIEANEFLSLPETTIEAIKLGFQKFIGNTALDEVKITSDYKLKNTAKDIYYVGSGAFFSVLKNNLKIQTLEKVQTYEKELTSTGERKNINENRAYDLEPAVFEFLWEMARSNATLTLKDTELIVKLAQDYHLDQFSDFPAALDQFIVQLMAIFGNNIQLHVTEGQTIFTFNIEESSYSSQRYIEIQKGKTTEKNSGGLQVQINLLNEKWRKQFMQIYRLIINQIKDYRNSETGETNWKGYLEATNAERLALTKKQENLKGAIRKVKIGLFTSVETIKQKAKKAVDVSNFLIYCKQAVMTAAIIGIIAGAGYVFRDDLSSVVNNVLPPAMTELIGNFEVPLYNDRMPGISSIEAPMNVPRIMGEIIHLPNTIEKKDLSSVGYFPRAVITNLDGKALGIDTKMLKPFTNVTILDVLTSTIDSKPEQLVYKPLAGFNSLYPPNGWKFAHIYQVGGDGPVTNELGGIFWNGQIPKEVVLVAERIKPSELVSGFQVYEGLSPFGVYQPNANIDEAIVLNKELSADPDLQDIHSRLLQDIFIYQSSGNKNPTEISNQILEDLNLLKDYVKTNRFYNFGFPLEHGRSKFNTVISLANQKEAGYQCSVAAASTYELLQSVGIIVGSQPGSSQFIIGEKIVEKDTHASNIIFLPDGRTVYLDITPELSDKTPERVKKVVALPSEDEVSRMQGASVPQPSEFVKLLNEVRIKVAQFAQEVESLPIVEDVSELISNSQIDQILNSSAVKTGLPIGTLVGIFAYRLLLPNLKRRSARRRMERAIVSNRISPIEAELISGVISQLTTAQGAENKQQYQAELSSLFQLVTKYDEARDTKALTWFIENPTIIFEGATPLDPKIAYIKTAFANAKNTGDLKSKLPKSMDRGLTDTWLMFCDDYKMEEVISNAELVNKVQVPEEFTYYYQLALILLKVRQQKNQGIAPNIDIIRNVMSESLEMNQKNRLLQTLNTLLSPKAIDTEDQEKEEANEQT